MARIRTIKPEFFTSLTIDKLSLTAQRTFVGLWTYADDHGRGLDDTRLIKAAIWPLRDTHTAAKVEKDMKALAALDLIRRYEIDGGRYFQILGWAEHQRVNRPSTSRIPQVPPPEDSVKPHGADDDDSPGERNGKELGKGTEEKSSALTEPSTPNGHPYTNCPDCGLSYDSTLDRCPACAVRAGVGS